MTRDQYAAQCEAEEAACERELEWRHITRQLEALYGAVRAGDGSVYTRQRIGRLEALQAALQGFPEALAA
ncbi:hypothetical protein Shyhy02_29750 [Streptomyces hygroscopicus subsp. hygroscopicus]|nr:hypothetical protein Shyhy02_29750 [Streptomyces hygroscopicus subsp. hygroscopicus]